MVRNKHMHATAKHVDFLQTEKCKSVLRHCCA